MESILPVAVLSHRAVEWKDHQ